MKMSLSPTNCRTVPDASVLNITFGRPSGRTFMAAVPIVVPADPPMASTPDTSPFACAILMSCAAPAAAVVTASPRSARAWTSASGTPASSNSRSRGMSASTAGGPIAPASTSVTGTPHDVSRPLMNAASTPLVSSVAIRKTEGTRANI